MTTIPEAMQLALARLQAGQWQEARQICEQVLVAAPRHAPALHLLGQVSLAQGHFDAAASSIGEAIDCDASNAVFHANLGEAFRGLNRHDDALASYDRALQQAPDWAEAHNNRGTLLLARGDTAGALAGFQKALALKPDYLDALCNQGNALQDAGQLPAAVESYGRALAIEPRFALAAFNLGHALRKQGRLDEAVASYRSALAARPDYLAAAAALVHELQHVCDWTQVESLTRRVIDAVERDDRRAQGALASPLSFLTLPLPTTAEQQLCCARQWARGLSGISGAKHGLSPRPAQANSRRKIGYLSADFHSHATAMLIAELFEKHDRTRYEIVGYSYGPHDEGAMRERIVNALDRFVDVRDLTAEQAARRIEADGLEILVDLKGYTQGARTTILAQRPAPVQVNYLGYPGTMGADFIDYILVDDFIVPADQQPFFTERLVHLPGCYQVNDSRRAIADRTPSRDECGLPEQGFVFCSFNNNYKITPAMFDVWMRLLAAIEGSVLWLFAGNRFAPDHLRREAQARGVAVERLVFAPRLEAAEHLARHRLADLFLDTYPVNAHTTASDALWAGCPLLTLAGETFVARVAGSLLRALGLPELIANNLTEYEATALRLARDPHELAALRARLGANRATASLFKAAPFARHLEQAYDRMWQIYASGEQPHGFTIEAD